MIELSKNETRSLRQSFAGDVFNSAVYLKRVFSEVEVSFATAIGRDSYSDKFMALCQSELVRTEFIYRSETKIPGLYSIETDSQGERSFTYWRNDSAARQVMQFIDSAETTKLAQQKMFFFSGISLAVVKLEDREKFWKLIEALRDSGVTIVFDPNYRARMWSNPNEAKEAIEKALGFSDICLPGVEDFQQLYGHQSALDIVDFCEPYGVKELVIKNGEKGVSCMIDGELYQFSIDAITKVVDSTSAGDSFNGVYLGARMSGLNPSFAVELASKSAAEVIQHQGAIVPRKDFQRFVENLAITPITDINYV
jgi:2-dehydro-3-deoxygluconokinase